MRFSRVFTKTVEAAQATSHFLSSCGGTRSGKTFSILQFLFLLISQDTRPTINSVVSQTYPQLEKGAIRDFKQIAGIVDDDPRWSESKHTYTFPNGAILEFFSVEKPDRAHGPQRDRIFVNEAQTIAWSIIDQLLMRTAGLAIFDYNPTREFWLNTRIESQPDCVTIHSTYLDNVDRDTGEPLLSREQVAFIESHRGDETWWRVYGMGLTGHVEGLVYPDVEIVKALPPEGERTRFSELFGVDFGYHHPTAVVRVLADSNRREAYMDEVLYESYLTNRELAEMMVARGVPRGATIYGDCAAPTSIKEVNSVGGFRIRPCRKVPTVAEQVKFIKGWRLMVTAGSPNIRHEVNSYQWMQDKLTGQWLDTPDKDANVDHAMDAMRYALFTHFGRIPGNGGRSVTVKMW